MYYLAAEDEFPPVSQADEDGILAISENITLPRLIAAYQKGIFPWYNEGEPVLWWYPNPRCVLFPEKLKVSKSMQKLMRKNIFIFEMNTAFPEVINNCRHIFREDQNGTWITDEIVNAYTQLHLLGYAHSAECYLDGKLVGGLYGVKMGKVFFGESMFSLVSNASKFAFIKLVEKLNEEGIDLIDCQITSEHLLSLGAEEVSAGDFEQLMISKVRCFL